MAASSRMSRTFARQSPRSRIATIVIGVLKNWASCHPTKPVRLMPCERPPELQNRVQTIRAGTDNLFFIAPVEKQQVLGQSDIVERIDGLSGLGDYISTGVPNVLWNAHRRIPVESSRHHRSNRSVYRFGGHRALLAALDRFPL